MRDVRISPLTLVLLVAVVGGGAFAAGNATTATREAAPVPRPEPTDFAAGPEQNQDQLPPGHPPVDPQAGGGGADTPGDLARAPADDHALEWKAPARWQLVPNASAMRLATYRVPRAPGDAADAEVSIARAGGSVDANIDRWIGQFDAEGQKTAKRTARKVGSLDVSIVEVEGTYAGGMGKDESPHAGWALVGAIVVVPGLPYFFKLTGPAKSVLAARGELDGMLGSLVQRKR